MIIDKYIARGVKGRIERLKMSWSLNGEPKGFYIEPRQGAFCNDLHDVRLRRRPMKRLRLPVLDNRKPPHLPRTLDFVDPS